MAGRQSALADTDFNLVTLTVVNFVFFDNALRSAYSTQLGQPSITNPQTRIELVDWEVVTDLVMLLGKAGVQELEGIDTQLSEAGIQEMDVTRTQLVLKTTVVAAPTNPSADESRI